MLISLACVCMWVDDDDVSRLIKYFGCVRLCVMTKLVIWGQDYLSLNFRIKWAYMTDWRKCMTGNKACISAVLSFYLMHVFFYTVKHLAHAFFFLLCPLVNIRSFPDLMIFDYHLRHEFVKSTEIRNQCTLYIQYIYTCVLICGQNDYSTGGMNLCYLLWQAFSAISVWAATTNSHSSSNLTLFVTSAHRIFSQPVGPINER